MANYGAKERRNEGTGCKAQRPPAWSRGQSDFGLRKRAGRVVLAGSLEAMMCVLEGVPFPIGVLVNWCALEWTGMQSSPAGPIEGESLLPRPLFAAIVLTASPQPGR